jgi:FkbM family methyltransferase
MYSLNMESKPPRPLADCILQLAQKAFPNGGVYVEAGAHDGVSQSNTLLLNNIQWSGLLIEPSPISFEKLKFNRPNDMLANVALVGSDGITMIRGTFGEGSLMSSADVELMSRTPKEKRSYIAELIHRFPNNRISKGLRNTSLVTTQVPAKTFDMVLHEYKVTKIDILILDVEGFELEALRGFGFHPKPRVVIIETQYKIAAEISNLMLSKGFVLCGNFSNFSKEISPTFTEDRQDYVWVSRDDLNTIKAISEIELFQ